LAAVFVGGIAGSLLDSNPYRGTDYTLAGAVAAVLAFTCARLWITKP
jgi:hypothetical protein